MKGDRLMNNSIIFLDTPFETKEADWLFENNPLYASFHHLAIIAEKKEMLKYIY